ncbi:MAG: alpha/beta fold hydrolase [Oscillochloridaceae bacterium umkhey_bin13]
MPSRNTMFYAERGHGRALVCLHGAGGLHTHWGQLLTGLAEHGRVVAPDFPGHGRSTPPAPADLAAYGAATLAFLDALELEQAILVGHSMGAAAALEAYLVAPNRVAGLILIGAAARLRVAPALLTGLADDPPAAVTQLVNAMYPEAASALRPDAINEYLRDPRMLAHDLQACNGWDRRADLRPGPPSLVLVGSDDLLTPPKLGTELSSLLAGQCVTLEGVGHAPMIQAPAATLAAIHDWLALQR